MLDLLSKKRITALLAATMIMTSIPTVWAAPAAESIQITINTKEVTATDAKPFIANGRTMVPVRLISEGLGAQVEWDATKQLVTITQGNSVVHVTIQQTIADAGGKQVTLDAPAVIQNGRTFVPLRFISESLGAKVEWNQQERVVSIVTTNTGGQTTDNSTGQQPNNQTEQQQPDTSTQPVGDKLSIEEANQLALKNNSDLRALRIDADSADLNARLVNAKVKDIPSDAIGSVDLAQQKYINKAKADMAKKVNNLYVKATEKKIVLGVKKAYYDLLNAEADLHLKKQSMSRAETQSKQAELAFKLGTRAKTDVLQAQAAVAGANASFASAENNWKITQMKLNSFIGVDLDKEWAIAQDALATDNQKMDRKTAVELALKQRAEVLQKQEEIKVAELNKELIDKYSSLATYQGELSINEVEKSKLNLEDTKREITIEVTQAYLNLHMGKEALEANKKALDATKENYRLVKLRFDNGLSTMLETIQAEEELSNRENQYQSAVYNYNLAIINFENALGN